MYSVGKPYKHIPKKGVVMLESSTTSNNLENENNDVNVDDDRMMLVTAPVSLENSTRSNSTCTIVLSS